MLTSMSPKRATDYVSAFELPADEEASILLHDVRGLSYQQISEICHACPETIKARRRKAYSKIVDAIEYEKSRED